jgi:hypothetical protein
MYPPIFTVCAANAGVQAALGTNPVRLYPFSEAPQGVTKAYAVWQIIGGGPGNYINQIPSFDEYTLQVDVYAATVTAGRAAAEALRDAIEPVAHIVRWGGESRDPETKNYRFSFDVDFIVNREISS